MFLRFGTGENHIQNITGLWPPRFEQRSPCSTCTIQLQSPSEVGLTWDCVFPVGASFQNRVGEVSKRIPPMSVQAEHDFP